MSIRSAVATPIGILKGRDCVGYFSLAMERGSGLTIRLSVHLPLVENLVKVNPGIASVDRNKLVISFSGVVAVQVLELETWEYQNEDSYAFNDSSFELVGESPWIAKLTDTTGEYQPMVSADDRHFELLTYDHVIAVICSDFTFRGGGDV